MRTLQIRVSRNYTRETFLDLNAYKKRGWKTLHNHKIESLNKMNHFLAKLTKKLTQEK